MRCWKAAAVTASVVALGLSPSVAFAGEDGDVTTVVTGLNDPRQLNDYDDHHLVVAESDTGEVSKVNLDSG